MVCAVVRSRHGRYDTISSAGQFLRNNGDIYQALPPSAVQRMQRLLKLSFMERMIAAELLPELEIISASKLDFEKKLSCHHLLKFQNVSLITYPWEWSFDMLKDAALAQLTLLGSLLENGYNLTGGHATQMTYARGKMKFMDPLSIREYKAHDGWNGYGDFYEQFLLPLLSSRVPFQEARVDSASMRPEQAQTLLFRRSDPSESDGLQRYHSGAFHRKLKTGAIPIQELKNMLKAMREFIAGLERPLSPREQHWASYPELNTYSAEDRKIKKEFVARGLSRLGARGVVDLGANTGEYAALAAQTCAEVIAVDLETSCIDRLYQIIRADKRLQNITPIVADILNPFYKILASENSAVALMSRLKTDAFLALALIHHITIPAKKSLKEIVALFHQIAPAGIVEWISDDDPMVSAGLSHLGNTYKSYTWDTFIESLKTYFEVLEVQPLHSGERKLCLVGVQK